MASVVGAITPMESTTRTASLTRLPAGWADLIVSVVNREARQIIQARGLLEMATSLQELRMIKPSLGDLGDGLTKGLASVWCPEAVS
jgi:hypothetical protein